MAKPQEQLEEMVKALNEQEEQSFAPFEINSLEDAAEAQRRIAYFREQAAEIDAIVNKQLEPFLAKIEKIRDWGEQAKQEYTDKESFYSAHLEVYIRKEVEEQLAKGKKPKKTIKLPYGAIKLAKQQPEFQKDEEQLLEYAKSAGFLKVKESTDWAELKKKCQVVDGKLVDENGEVVPGVHVVERDDKFNLVIE